MRVCSVCLSRSPNESFTTERVKKASLKRRVKFVARKSVKNTRSSFPSKDDVVSPTKDTQRARTISFDIRAEEERDVREAAAASRAALSTDDVMWICLWDGKGLAAGAATLRS